jgi:chromosome segregation ATPase
MNTKTEATVRGIKDLGGEVSAWEVRLLALQNESETIRRSNEQKKKEIESALALAQQELDRKRDQVKVELAKSREASDKLQAEKEEFQGILQEFNKEKRAFEAERSKIEDRDKDTQKLRDKLSNFIHLIKREAQSF